MVTAALTRRTGAKIIKIAAVAVFAWLVHAKLASQYHLSLLSFFYLMGVGSYGASIGTSFFRWRPGRPFVLNPWRLQGGLSTLGALLGIALVVPVFLWGIGVPVLPGMDVIARYLPLQQSMMRIGCFYAGCCAGRTPFTQLYSSMMLGVIFLLLAAVPQVPGLVLGLYLLLASTERFLLSFLRMGRGEERFFSRHRVTAAALFFVAFAWTCALLALRK